MSQIFNASVIFQNPKLISIILKGMKAVHCDRLKKNNKKKFTKWDFGQSQSVFINEAQGLLVAHEKKLESNLRRRGWRDWRAESYSSRNT